MSFNQVYKKDPDSIDGSISPGLSQDGSSLVDIFIENSRNAEQQHRTNHGGQTRGAGPAGPSMTLLQQDHLYLQQPAGEMSMKQMRSQISDKSHQKHGGSFVHSQKERAQGTKQEKIDQFFNRQKEFEKRKDKNLKKLTKEQIKKEREGGSISMMSPRQQDLYRTRSGKKTTSRNSSRKKKQTNNIGLDSFDGVKDGVVNKKHCEPHSTSSNLALQTLKFPSGFPPAIDSEQYLTAMNTHSMLLQSNPSGEFISQQHRQTSQQVLPQFSPVMPMNGHMGQIPDYYKTNAAFQASQSFLPRPYQSSDPQRNLPFGGGRPVPPQMAQSHAAFGAAGNQEEVLDEFPVPTNVHVAPKQTDMSIQQQSFLQMQHAINQSSRFDDQQLYNQLGAFQQESHNVTGIMMQALSPQEGAHMIGQGPEMAVTPIRHFEGQQNYGGVTNHRNKPSGIGILAGSNMVSQSLMAPSQQVLDATQIIMHGGTNKIQKRNTMDKLNHSSRLPIQQPYGDRITLALGEQQMFSGRYSSGQIANDIEMLDSEFAQEESRQIEAYYKSINKESQEKVKGKKNVLNQPRRSSKREDRSGIYSLTSPPAKTSRHGHKHNSSEKLLGGVKVGVSRLDFNGMKASPTLESQNQTANRSEISNKNSERSAKRANAKAIAQARQHLQKMSQQKRETENLRRLEERKKKMVKEHHKNVRDELYLSNKLTRQFIMVTSLVMQSEDLSEDSVFNYAQYTEFAIRFGLMSERAASEESDERALLYEMWCTLSRVHSDFAFIRVVNLKTLITAILGFPIAIHRNPNMMQPKRNAAMKVDRRADTNAVIDERRSETDDTEFQEADNMEDEVPLENNNEMRASRQPLNVERQASKSTYKDQSQSFESSNFTQSRSSKPPQLQANRLSEGQRPRSIIDEYDELRAAENGQLSSPEAYPRKAHHEQPKQQQHKQAYNHANGYDEDEEQYFFDRQGQEEGSDSEKEQEGQTYDGETTSQNEYAIDRAHKIGFFVEHFEFCMTMKDVRTVQRRFKLFQKNWREFQKKDLVVKKSVIVDDGATFKPQICKKSEQLIRNKEQGNIEFPMSTRSDFKVQRRQRIWERDLPRGIKSKERLHEFKEHDDDRGTWLMQTAPQSTASGLPFSQNVGQYSSRGDYNRQGPQQMNDYFAMGTKDQNMQTFGSSTFSGGKSTSQERRGLTTPSMTQRMEQIYQVGKQKLLNRQDQDKNYIEFDKCAEECTFTPKISEASLQISNQRSFSTQDKPWAVKDVGSARQRNFNSQQQLAERMQLSIQKDIQRKRMGLKEKLIKEKVMSKGGFRKDYERSLESNNDKMVSRFSQESFTAKPAFKKYDGKVSKPARPQTKRKDDGVMRANSRSQITDQERYPMTTNTSINILKTQTSPHEQQDFTNEQNQPGKFREDSDATPTREFASPDSQMRDQDRKHMTRKPPHTMLHQHISNATQQSIRQMSPTRAMSSHLQSLETGGIQHSGDEQGRAPLESQSSIQNVHSTHSVSKDVTDEPTGTNASTAATGLRDSQPSQTYFLQKAMEQLTVIQETTFEQTAKGQKLQGVSESGYMSQNTSIQNRKPLLYIEVDTNGAQEGGIERIEVYKGDDPRQLATEFCKKHDYDEGTQIVLQRQIEEKLARAHAKLEAKMQEKRSNRLAEKFRQRQMLKAQQQ